MSVLEAMIFNLDLKTTTHRRCIWVLHLPDIYIYIYMQVSNAHSLTCTDVYIFATPYRWTWDGYFLSREHTLEFNQWEGKEEFEYVRTV